MNLLKEKICNFFISGGIIDKEACINIFHEELVFDWYSSKGYSQLDLNGMLALSKDLSDSYQDLHGVVHEYFEEDDRVHISYTFYVKTNENPDEEILLATFMSNWKIKNDKLYYGVQMSQLM